MDTIALISSFLALNIGLFTYGEYSFGAILIMFFGVVLIGEYYNIKKRGMTISKQYNTSMPKIKWTLIGLMWLFLSCLTVHFML